MAGRPKNIVESLTLSISVTPKVKFWLERLTESGTYGKNASEAAGRIVDERIRQLLVEGKFISLEEP